MDGEGLLLVGSVSVRLESVSKAGDLMEDGGGRVGRKGVSVFLCLVGYLMPLCCDIDSFLDDI